MERSDREDVERVARVIREAEAILVGAGAGMGVDSGLPDFRGGAGFWRAYPPFAALGLSFREVANPRWFERDPELAWGFYGHRLRLYRETAPHDGFRLLREWAEGRRLGAFVYTSNVDGHFQKSGWPEERIVECHGSIHHLQSVGKGDGEGIWSADGIEVDVDERTMRARRPLPACRRSGRMARPNILMFGDWGWDESRTAVQEDLFRGWLSQVAGARLAVIEIGAGLAVPTVRMMCESVVSRNPGATLIRINPRDWRGPAGTLSLRCGALEGILGISASTIR